MKCSTEAFVASFLIFLCLPKFVLSNLENQMIKSLQMATRCKKSRTPPTEPVLAFSPKRYAQLVAVLRTRTNAPTCGKLGSGSFNLKEPKTWPFCALGNCIGKKCKCISSYIGPNCSQFGGKCWLIYCFLKSCKKSFQNIHCKCDPSYYGTEVLSGDYWYDEGKKESYVAPPSDWSDDLNGDEGAKMSAVIEDIKFPSFDNKPSPSDSEKQEQPANPPTQKQSSAKVSSVEQPKHEGNVDQPKHEENANHENEDELHLGNEDEESGDDETEDLGDYNEDESSSSLFTPVPIGQMVTILSIPIFYTFFC